jgi:hypothetical protein
MATPGELVNVPDVTSCCARSEASRTYVYRVNRQDAKAQSKVVSRPLPPARRYMPGAVMVGFLLVCRLEPLLICRLRPLSALSSGSPVLGLCRPPHLMLDAQTPSASDVIGMPAPARGCVRGGGHPYESGRPALAGRWSRERPTACDLSRAGYSWLLSRSRGQWSGGIAHQQRHSLRFHC